MKKSMYVYIVSPDWAYEKMFCDLGFTVIGDMGSADLVCFTGGSDVSPHLYGEKNVRSFCDARRDDLEQKIFQACVENQIPMVGICRGGQFLNVMNGGKMWQHVDGHAGSRHMVKDLETGFSWLCTSTHHQMMIPSADAQIVGISEEELANTFIADEISYTSRPELQDDIEVLWYEKTKCLCFQPHPEFDLVSCRAYFNELLWRFYHV